MAGGLLQLVSYGIQNKYLTQMPEITFFKIVYRRHTHFGKEMVLIDFDQEIGFGKKVSLTIPNIGDLLSNSYIHFSFDKLVPDITLLNENIQTLHQNNINDLVEEITFLKNQISNLKTYSNFIFGGLKIIEKYENTLNVSLDLFKNLVSPYHLEIKEDFNAIIDYIDTTIVSKSNIFSKLLDLNEYSSTTELITSKNTIYDYLIRQNNILLNRLKQKNIKLESLQNYPIKYHWKKNLAHYLINNIEVEIDGEIIDTIYGEQLEIFFQHHFSQDEKNNYTKMVNGKSYQDFELFLPLKYLFFNQSYGLSLPLVALRYSTVKLNIDINSIENVIDFIDFDIEYNKLLNLTYDRENLTYTYNVDDNIVTIDGNVFDISTLNYDYDTYQVSLKTSFIFKENLQYHFNLDDDEADFILNNYGTSKNSGDLSLNLQQFKNLLLNINSLSFYIPYIQYYANRLTLLSDYTLNTGNCFNEYIFLDQIEREKFASANLNYIVKLNVDNEFTIDEKYFNTNLEIESYVTDFYWFLQYNSNLQGNNFNGPDYLNILNNNNIFNFQFKLDQYDTFHKLNTPEFFNQVIPHKYLNSSFDNNFFYYSFCLYPEENQPSGGVSLGDIPGKQFIINLNEDTSVSKSNFIKLKIYFRKLSILTINKGKGKLAFTTK